MDYFIVIGAAIVSILLTFFLITSIKYRFQILNDVAEWMEKEENEKNNKRYFKYGYYFLVRWLFIITAPGQGIDVYMRVQDWKKNVKPLNKLRK